MKLLKKCCVALLLATIIALTLRGFGLTQRPMHTDEAVHAIKFIDLLEHGQYRYDPIEYHGPALNYFTLAAAWFEGAKTSLEIDEYTLRVVPVVFGVLIVLLFFLFYDGLGSKALVFGAFLTAISPAFVFYSRYYIQEILLVFFTFAFIAGVWRYWQSRKIKWVIASGVSAGLMHATKETCVIAFGAIFISALIVFFLSRKDRQFLDSFKKISTEHIVVGILSAGFISALFYSSFFTNMSGVVDSFLTYKSYLTKAGENKFHIHNWYYYLERLVYFKSGDGPIWSEGFIVVLAVVGFVLAAAKKVPTGVNVFLARFVAFYTLIMVVVYSAVAYKTPWCCLGFLHGMIILAGIAMQAIVEVGKSRVVRGFVWVVCIAGLGHLAFQSYLGCYKYDSNPVNPYVYAHTSKDIFKMVDKVKQAALLSGYGDNLAVDVVCSNSDYWPLPWYLRQFKNVAWESEMNFSREAEPVIIISPDLQNDLMKKLYEMPEPGKKNMYLYLFEPNCELRANVNLLGFISKDLHDIIGQNEAGGKNQ
ncbi:MAG TPA: TIGR03663 family protein [Sedimentisphaerales bacterium]|nr:TIGR03663 family protein [Sedimentisphaerales bacterium]